TPVRGAIATRMPGRAPRRGRAPAAQGCRRGSWCPPNGPHRQERSTAPEGSALPRGRPESDARRRACEHRSMAERATPPPGVEERLRALPSVDRLATAVARAELAERRAELLAGAGPGAPGGDDEADLVAGARGRLRPSLR